MPTPAARRTLHTRVSLASGPVLLGVAGVAALLGQKGIALWLLIVGVVVGMMWPLLVSVAYEHERTEERRSR